MVNPCFPLNQPYPPPRVKPPIPVWFTVPPTAAPHTRTSKGQPVRAGAGPHSRPRATADAAAAVERKARMAECYDSQIDSEMVGTIAAFSRTYGGRERFWANPVFCASALASEATS